MSFKVRCTTEQDFAPEIPEIKVKADALFAALADTVDEPMPQDAFDRVWKGIENKLNRTYE